jgi:hypothetical protein
MTSTAILILSTGLLTVVEMLCHVLSMTVLLGVVARQNSLFCPAVHLTFWALPLFRNLEPENTTSGLFPTSLIFSRLL